jgi:DNA-directed RNA polymerase beta subunit
MDIIDELLPTIDLKCLNKDILNNWEHFDTVLMDAFLQKNGIHRDSYVNFNSFLPEILNLIKTHVKLRFIDNCDRLHRINVISCNYVKPYENKYGIDDCEQALLRGSYEASIYGTVVYTIHMKKPSIDSKNINGQYDEMDQDVLDGNNNDNDGDDDDNDDDDGGGGDEGNDDDDDDDYEIGSDDDDDNDDDDVTIVTDDEEEEDDEEEDEKTKEKKKTKNSNYMKNKQKNKSFNFTRNNDKLYTELIHTAEKDNHLIMNMPVFVGSNICNMKGPFGKPSQYFASYLKVPSFIVNRNRKICPLEEYIVNNRIIMKKIKKEKTKFSMSQFYQLEIRCKFYEPIKKYRTNCTLKFSLEIPNLRKMSFWKRPCNFRVEIPYQKAKYISMTVLAMAFGWCISDFIAAIKMYFMYDENFKGVNIVDMYLRNIENDVNNCESQRDALLHIGKLLDSCKNHWTNEEIISYVSYSLRGEFFPNLNIINSEKTADHFDAENIRKGYMIAKCASELIKLSPFVNSYKPDKYKYKIHDTKSYTLKRVETPGEKLTALTRMCFKNYNQKAQSKFMTAIEGNKTMDLNLILSPKNINLTKAVGNGTFNPKPDAPDGSKNKTQLMIAGFCSDLQSMQAQKILKAALRKNQKIETLLSTPDQAGRVCSYLFPESQQCGSTRFKTLGCVVSHNVDFNVVNKVIMRTIKSHASHIGWIPVSKPWEPKIFKNLKEYTMVFDVYNGLVGWVKYPVKLYKLIRSVRSRGFLNSFVGMEFKREFKRDCTNMFRFTCDAGRFMRPLVIVEKLPQLIKCIQNGILHKMNDPVHYLLQHGMIEYLDASEEYSGICLTADKSQTVLDTWDKKTKQCNYTHLEVHPTFTFNIMVAKPFANFNQGPRRLYTGNMDKRSISLKLFPDRGTTSSNSLFYGEKPLMGDPVNKALQLRENEPNSTNVMLAIMSHADNIEDAFVMKKEAFEAGLAKTYEIHTRHVSLGKDCFFGKPDNTCKGKMDSDKYRFLNDNGTPKIGAIIKGGTAIVGKIYQTTFKKQIFRRCISTFTPWNSYFRIEDVDCYPRDGRNPEVIRVSMRKVNTPAEGDKYFFGHGQKGTGGRYYRAVDLPFITNGPNAGVVPDVFMNVNALMRGTTGLLLETIFGTARALSPSEMKQWDTLFLSEDNFEKKLRICGKVLKRFGLSHTGKSKMRCGKYGTEIKCGIFTGLAAMRVLRHRAKDKLRSRERGPINELTKQTSIGQKQFGGLKAGEMENANWACHGATSMFQSINFESADKYWITFCTKCQMKAIGCLETNFFFCKMCNSFEHLIRLKIPYTTNLSQSEMFAASWGTTFQAHELPPTQVYKGGDFENDMLQIDEDAIYHNFKYNDMSNELDHK